MSETFRLHDEPLSFRDKAFIALSAQLVEVFKTGKESRRLSCDIQGAWDLACAMEAWREKMRKANDH